ncbi:MAG: ATP-dependent DNA helicase RecG [Bacteroidales bacterium]|nr:MAG: ATP-dependent DNA helicase RecG [Bacteroidales bacterium]
MDNLLSQEIKFLPGVGPKRAELLGKELNIFTMEDLLYYFPYKYIDRTKFYKVQEVHGNLPYIQIRGKITEFRLAGGGPSKRLVADFTDETGVLELVWFKGLKWIRQNLKPGKEYILFGKPSLYNNKVNLVHPEIEEAEKQETRLVSSLQAFYNTTEKLKSSYINSRVIQKLQSNLLKQVRGKLSETLPDYLVKKLNLISLPEALLNIHFPENPGLLKKSRMRLKFEELFFIQLNLLKQKNFRKERFHGHPCVKVGEYFNNFYRNNLTFELTEAQKRVLKEIRKDLGSGKQMNRLLQGDVGSGKTLVALMSILIALDNGYQGCLMAPTEVLANQHFQTIQGFLENMDIHIALLTGSTKQTERKEIHKDLQSGQLQILIGTHALIEETVIFNNLGIVIIDEQHRFGVAQRAKLWKKNPRPPHILVMTATPIPRTLAMTLYGDLEVSVINELPPGRKPIKTVHYYDSKRLRLFGFLRKQIEEGRQIYIVYPLIKESEKMDYKDLEDGYESISRDFPPPDYAVSIVHGRMKPEERDIAMRYFISGKTHIMVATTVIEVGVDIRNATVMVIESAERFGLSQLHQLRGRVGRGTDQSYCILMSSVKLTAEAKKRLSVMVRTNDGFEIAEMDLKLRGPGDIEGTQQSGIPFDLKIANLGQDGQILQYARNVAEQILDDDPLLTDKKNLLLVKQIRKLTGRKFDWSAIS